MNHKNTLRSNIISPIIYIFILFMLSSCGMRYYKSTKIPSENFEEKINNALENGKYFIIHQRNNEWHLANPAKSIENGVFNIIGQLDTVGNLENEMRDRLIINQSNRQNLAYSSRFGRKNKASHQIHLFVSDSLALLSNFGFPITSILKIEDYITAPGATFFSHLALNTIPPAIILAIACNCPYVFSYDNKKLNFEGNLYSGAIYPNLERHDYLTIPNMAATDGKYKFKLENPRDDEQQFTNFMQLMVVNHSDQVKVLPDRKGNLHTIKELQKPIEALSFDSKNQLAEVADKDGKFYQFDEYQEVEDLNGMVLKFKNEAKSNNPKLVLSLKNSDWSAYIYKEVMSLFGNKLPVWQKKKRKHSTNEINARSVAQGTLLSAYLKTKSGWKFIDFINTPGSIATREIIVPIEIIDINSDIEIMLKGGFRFWDLDFAAMDFSPNETLKIDYLQPELVLDSLGNDYSAALQVDDSNYLNQLTVSDKYKIYFDIIPQKENLSQTMILNAKGYYNRLDKFDNKIQLGELLKIKKSSFSAFSRKKFLEITTLYATSKP